jgi:hypothetical protein
LQRPRRARWPLSNVRTDASWFPPLTGVVLALFGRVTQHRTHGPTCVRTFVQSFRGLLQILSTHVLGAFGLSSAGHAPAASERDASLMSREAFGHVLAADWR